jgi:hypothetical protein
MSTPERFEDAFLEVQGYVQEVLRLDEGDLDPEAASSYQDKATKAALRWIVDNTTDDFAHGIAEQALLAVDSDGRRW